MDGSGAASGDYVIRESVIANFNAHAANRYNVNFFGFPFPAVRHVQVGRTHNIIIDT